MKLIINLPALNEEKSIGKTIKKIPKSFNGITKILIQVIDDGSTDNTVTVSKKAGADIILSHVRNLGLGKMFSTMRDSAIKNNADIVVNIDADGQFNPNDIQKMINPIISGKADIVSADRFSKNSAKNIPVVKDKLNRLGALIVGKALDYPVADLTCGFRAHNREALLRLNTPTGFTYTQETIIDAIGKKLRIVWIPIDVTYHENRKSRVVKTIWVYVNNSTKIIIKAFRDIRPMKFFGWPGLGLLGISFITLILFFIRYLPEMQFEANRNYLFTSIALFLIGLQFVIFALVADMVKNSRILTEELLYEKRKKSMQKID